jgi:hypothetical protein
MLDVSPKSLPFERIMWYILGLLNQSFSLLMRLDSKAYIIVSVMPLIVLLHLDFISNGDDMVAKKLNLSLTHLLFKDFLSSFDIKIVLFVFECFGSL